MNSYQILRKLSKAIFILGGGDFWYEGNERNNIFYKFYSVLIFGIMDVFTILEVMVVIFNGFPEDYVNEAKMFALTHIIMMIKRYNVRYNQKMGRQVNREMIRACSSFEDKEMYKTQYKRIKLNFVIYVTTVFMTLTLYVVNGLQRVIVAGEPFLTVTTYWPSYHDLSFTASAVRVFNVILLASMLALMIASDSMVVSNIVMLRYKYVTLSKYFDSLRAKSKRGELNKEKMVFDFSQGIIMHQDLLKLLHDIKYTFGVSMSIQVCLCSGSAVLLLMQFAMAKELTIGGIFITFFFLVTLLNMLGVILWNAGDMTYEASQLSNSIFQSGWHLNKVESGDIRPLVLLACAQAQRPVLMKAFGVSELSYATFVAVVRTTYSVFAVVYNGAN